MCLTSIRKNKFDPRKEVVGYKYGKIQGNRFITGVRLTKITIGRWVKCRPGFSFLYTHTNEPYLPGYNVYTSKKMALRQAYSVHDIVKCKLRNITTYGMDVYNETTYVGREIYIYRTPVKCARLK